MIKQFRKNWLWGAGLSLVLIGGFWSYRHSRLVAPTNLFIVKPVDLVQKVNVTGKVKARDKADLAFKQSGFVVSANRMVGDRVETGSVLAQLDSRDAEQAVNDAESALRTAQVDLARLSHPTTDRLTGDRLNKARQDGLSVLARVYADLGDILDSLDHTFFDRDFNVTSATDNNIIYYARIVSIYGPRFKTVPLTAAQSYESLKQAYSNLFALYQQDQAKSSDVVTEERLISDTYQFLKETNELIKLGRDLIQFFHDKSVADSWNSDHPELVTKHLTLLNTQSQTVTGYLGELGTITNTISEAHRDDITNHFSLENEKVAVAEKQALLANAEAKLEDYLIRAPFAATVTVQEARVGEFATAGKTLVSLISTKPFIVEANIPEVDIAKVKLHDTAILTFDAYGSEVKFEAEVEKIDPAETIVSGVPTYKVTLNFKQVDERIRSGMTANIDLLTGRLEQVLAVPRLAVNFADSGPTINLLRDNQIVSTKVTLGLAASDGQIEVTSGLSSGDSIVLP